MSLLNTWVINMLLSSSRIISMPLSNSGFNNAPVKF